MRSNHILLILILTLSACHERKSSISENKYTLWSLKSDKQLNGDYFRLRVSEDSITILYQHSGYRSFSSSKHNDQKIVIDGESYDFDISENQMRIYNPSAELTFERIPSILNNFTVTNDFIVSKYNYFLSKVTDGDSLQVDSIERAFLDEILGSSNLVDEDIIFERDQ